MTIWFTADTHFGEQPRTRQRAAALSADELDALIEQGWREMVAGDDIVWHLGDIGDWRRLTELPGIKHLVFGNNDQGRREIAASGVFASTATPRRKSRMRLFMDICTPYPRRRRATSRYQWTGMTDARSGLNRRLFGYRKFAAGLAPLD